VSHALITGIILVAAVAVFIWNRLPVGVVAICVALALYLTKVVSAEQAVSGFGDPVIVYIAALFVVSEGLDATGVTTWAGQKLVERAGSSPRSVVLLVILLVAVVTALISVNGAVAALVPMVVVLAMRTRQPSSQLMMPLAFGAHAGSLLALTGSPVNVLVSEMAVGAGQRPFRFFEFALVGGPLLAGTLLICLFGGPKLLPRRSAQSAPRDLSEHARTLAAQYALPEGARIDRTYGLVEVLVPPRSPFIGDVVFPGMVTESGQLIIEAIQRGGDTLTSTRLEAGDVLLLRGTWTALDENTADPGVLVVDPPQSVRRQAVPMGPGAKTALVIVAGMVVLLALNLVPPAIAALLAAVAMIVCRVITVPQAHRSISITTLVLVGGMIPLSTAIQVSGAADSIARGLIDVLGTASPYLLLFGIVLVVAVLGQLISNMATVLVVAPIALAIAADTGISPMPLLMAVAVAGAAAFLTPVATPANTMVMGPGAYRFGDYWKLGLPLLLLFLAVATFLVPVFWPFHP
jgi:di/tricarboxylate transporter